MAKQNIVRCLKSTDQFLIGLYNGIWAGDGTQYYDRGYVIKICCHAKDQNLINFIRNLLKTLFGKNRSNVRYEERNRALVKINSKFIYYFVYNYLTFENHKTYNVRLKEKINFYSKDFLEGFLIGLTLTDGYLKERFVFNVTSFYLAANVFDILKLKKYHPSWYTASRSKLGWKDLHRVSLTKRESQILKSDFDNFLKGFSSHTFDELKYEIKNEPAEI